MNKHDRRIVPQNQPVPVKVTMDNGQGDKVEYYMNFNNPTSVSKLVRSLHWALLNGRTVTMKEDTVKNADEYYATKHGHVESVIHTAKGHVQSGGSELLEQIAGVPVA